MYILFMVFVWPLLFIFKTLGGGEMFKGGRQHNLTTNEKVQYRCCIQVHQYLCYPGRGHSVKTNTFGGCRT
jgi:hypothetical protein